MWFHLHRLDLAVRKSGVSSYHTLLQLSGLRSVNALTLPLREGLMGKQRGKRQKGRPVVLTPRDRLILRLIGSCRYVSTTQIARELFSSVDRARRRIRQLFDNGYLQITLAGSTSPNLLSLTQEGARIVRTAFPDESENLRLPGAIRLAGVPHHLGIVNTRLYMEALARTNKQTMDAWESGAGRLARDLGLPGLGLQPDALAALSDTQSQEIYAAEVDCGTEPLAVLGRKLDRYSLVLQEQGGLDELWVVLAGTGSLRKAGIERLVMQAGLGECTRVFTQEMVVARPVLWPPARVAARGYGPKGPNTAPQPPTNPEGNRRTYTDPDRSTARTPYGRTGR